MSILGVSILLGVGRLWSFLPEEEQQNEAQHREEKQGDILGRAPVPCTSPAQGREVGSQEGEHVQQHGRVHGPKRLVASKYHPRKQQAMTVMEAMKEVEFL